MIVAIIPARSGSKRIPGKNIRMFSGKSIISYSIEAATKANVFDRIIVSTDSYYIGAVAKVCGAEVPFKRPANLSDDHTGTAEVIAHAISWLKENGCAVNYACCIYPTAPFIKPEYIRRGYELLREKKATTAVSVTTYPYPILRSLKLNDDGRIEMIWPENYSKRSQDLPEAYHDAGQFYWVDAERFLVEKTFFSKDSIPVMLPRFLVQDIDTEEDWSIAERMKI
ncbi:MAG TPA: pseudaminic acid cytidylyltransferase [bacterium]|nr:pseudaminic acid cytidylyltransferase [bacterium]